MPDLTPNRKALAEMGYYEVTAKEYLRGARRRDAEALHLFLTEGIDPHVRDKQGRTALMLAAWDGEGDSIEAATSLLAQGVEVNARSKDGESALLLATQSAPRSYRERLIKVLLEAGADPAARTPQGETPLSRSRNRHYGSKKCEQLIREALDK